jgi:hypothetical protein
MIQYTLDVTLTTFSKAMYCSLVLVEEDIHTMYFVFKKSPVSYLECVLDGHWERK